MAARTRAEGLRGLPRAERVRHFRRALMRSTTLHNAHGLAIEVFGMPEQERPFGTPAAVAARYRFVEPRELRAVLEQFCKDFGVDDPASVAAMVTNRVFHSNLAAFEQKRAQFFAPSPVRDTLGRSAADFMGVQALASLFGLDALANGAPINVPLVDRMMRRGALGLFTVGRGQFEMLAQVAVDLCAWLITAGRTDIVLIESPLGNSVPVAVLARVFENSGIRVEVVEWGCPRNDRAINGRTVVDSARDLTKIPEVAAAPLVLFVDDAITGSRFLKMAKALRKAIGSNRLGAVALRARFNPGAKFPVGQIRDLHEIRNWAAALGMPFGEETLPDLPLFRLDEGAPGLLETALAWGDAGHSAGKCKINILFYFLDRFEAITKDLGQPGQSEARDFLHNQVWQMDTSGQRNIIPRDLGEETHCGIIGALPPDFFDQIRAAAKQAFPHDYVGRAVIGEPEIRRRTDWLATCISNAALPFIDEQKAHFLNNAVNNLSQAGYTAGVDKPPRDHDYGLYTIPLPPGEDRLHLELVDLIVADAVGRTPRT